MGSWRRTGRRLLRHARLGHGRHAHLLVAGRNGELGGIHGAGLDVFDPEPAPLTSRLRNHPMIIATPHSASLTVEGRIRIETMAVERLLAYFNGERPKDMVNPEVFG